jgi:hypothetical protein
MTKIAFVDRFNAAFSARELQSMHREIEGGAKSARKAYAGMCKALHVRPGSTSEAELQRHLHSLGWNLDALEKGVSATKAAEKKFGKDPTKAVASHQGAGEGSTLRAHGKGLSAPAKKKPGDSSRHISAAEKAKEEQRQALEGELRALSWDLGEEGRQGHPTGGIQASMAAVREKIFMLDFPADSATLDALAREAGVERGRYPDQNLWVAACEWDHGARTVWFAQDNGASDHQTLSVSRRCSSRGEFIHQWCRSATGVFAHWQDI